MSSFKHFINHKLFSTIGEAADELGVDCYVIGGFVRDKFLDRGQAKDIDIVSIGSGIELAELVQKKLGVKRISVFKNFMTAQLKYKSIEIEFVGARKESYRADSRKPIVEDGTLEDDQKRRDLTINALALSLNSKNFGELLDPFNGLDDLKKGIIQTPLHPDQTYSDDPLRMMRSIRFASQLDFFIVDSNMESMLKLHERISIISQERIITEFNKILLSPQPSKGLALLFKTKLLHKFLPELVDLQGVEELEGQSHKDNFWHTLEVVDNVALRTKNLWLIYAALFHDLGKAVTKKYIEPQGWTFHNHEFVGAKMIRKIFQRLKLPLDERLVYVQKLIRLSSRPIAITEENATDSAARRLIFEASDDLEELMILCESDITTKNPRKKERFLANYKEVRHRLSQVEEADELRNWQPPIDGKEIMDTFNIKPGKEVGILKEAIREAILEGQIKNTKEEAFSFMNEKAKEIGLI